MAYIGQAPFQEYSNLPTKDSFTGDGSTTTFDMSAAVPVGSQNALEVFVNNVRQEPGTGKAFTLGQDGANAYKRLTFASAPTDGHAIYVINDRTSFTSVAPLPQDLNGSELILDADADTSITASTDDQIDFKIGGADEIIMTATALSPATSDGNALGTAALEWADLFLADGAVVSFGDDQEVTLTHVHDTGLLLSSTDKLQFGDSATFIHQSADGVMTVDGEATIDLNASTAVLVSNDLKLNSDSAVIGFGADNDTTLTHTDGTGLTLNSTNKICFNDTSQFIQGSSNAILSLGATDEIDLTATAIDINGTCDVSGAFTTGTTIVATGAITGASLTADDVAINGKVITMTGSASDTAVFTAATNGALSIVTTDAAAAAANIQITADGTAELAGTTVTLDSGGGITLDADSGTITFADGGASLGTITSSGYSGTAALATTLTITDNESTDENNVIVFVAGAAAAGGNVGLESDGHLTYNPSTGTLTTTNLVTSGTHTVTDSVTMTASNAVVFEGSTADAYETTLSTVDATADITINLPNVAGTIPVLAAVSATAITATPAEINLIDGGTARGTTAVASGDGILINDGGSMSMTNVDTVSTYFASHSVGGGNIVTTGALNSGSITSGFGAIDNGTSNIRSATITAETAFVPDASGGADLGTTALEFNDLFLNDSGSIQFGDDQDTTLVHTDGTGLTLNSTNKLCFNDASQFIQGSSATVLSIGATDEIDLTATTVDLNGTLNVSGVATFQAVPVLPANSIDSAHYVDGSIDNAHLADDAVDSDEIAAGAIDAAHMSANSIDSASYVDGSIDTAHIANDQITAALMADNSIDSDMYVDGSIDAAHLASDSVTEAKVAANSIDSQAYVDGSIDEVHLSDNSVDSRAYVDDSIDTAHYAAGSVDATALGADCVTAAKIGDNVLNSEHYAAGSIDNEHIADDAINSEHYAAGSIDTAHIANDQITAALMADNSIDSDMYVDGSIDNAHIADNAINSEHYADGSIDNAHIADDAINSEHYADGSIDTAHIGALQVTGAKLALDHRSANATDDVKTGNQHDYLFFDADVGISFFSANAEDMRLTDAGALHVDDDVIAFSTTISDERLKENIQPIEDALNKVNQLRGVTFTYISDGRDSAGLIAQDVEKVLPSAVRESELPLKIDDGNEYKILQYDQTIGLLVEAIKELTAKVEKLENK